ncbi:4Fe-4S binding protein [Acidianus ambivalens]|uniref:4Fe-4S ferredoxin n=1 Tax=Acidianus ambivalens TaxID=2283 RepID=A0A650CVG6_ACIAM|nr:4Fe-4S binding protein [Acidianus ambivalens]MQL55662.1 4Fe-4S ferredoxin [Acidianus ambivalens]QGR21758.1 4Fe-4S ferredoxin [Acidianus ambivalens]
MNYLQLAILVYIIGMMAADFIILYYLLRRPIVNKKAIFFVSSVLLYMSVEAVDIGYILFSHGSIIIEPASLIIASIPIILSTMMKNSVTRWREDKSSALTLALTIVADEIAMGYAYSEAFGPHINPLIDSVSNIAFGVMMLADSIFFLALSPRKIEELALFTFAASMAFMPNIFFTLSAYTELVGSLIASIIMIVNIITLYLIESRKLTFNAQLLSISLGFFDFVMMLSLSIYATSKDLYTISLTMIASMVWYFTLVLYRFKDVKIKLSLKYTLVFVIFINFAELTMGFGESVLGFRITNNLWMPSMMSMHDSKPIDHMHMLMWSPTSNPWWWIFPTDPWSMTSMAYKQAMMTTHNILFAGFWASYMLIMMTTMMPFYVVMMGAEMSYLVYERFKTAKNSNVKSWAVAILVGIPLFVWLLPYYTPTYIFGMSGMLSHINPEFAPTLLSLTLSLVAIALASTLFGRRAYCNLVCMSAHMWTNIYYDQFKPKKSSKIWEYIRWISLSIMVIVFTYVFLIYLGIAKNPSIGTLQIPLLDFYGMFTLNYIWWFFFFLTPVFGTYACARQGWCGFGNFAGLFNKILFKIKADSVDTCKSCKTVQCESACPVKIPIRTDVLSKGYTNRISCVGCGDCVEACPYNNLEIIDIRNAFRSAKARTS